jgi:murein DD-endopeptidase MepM/ murein hydrolase activator NlpD
MRKLYYFSKSNQKLKQFEYLKPKSILIYVIIAFFLLGISWGTISFIDHFTSTSKGISVLQNENKILRAKLKSLAAQYKNVDEDLKELRTENNYLRLATNLPTLSEDEIALGVGGSDFKSSYKSNVGSLDNLDDLSKYVDRLSLKLKFEKSEHQTISSKLKENEVLFASIPAIKPCEGVIGQNGFGMREHPILMIEKMHEGIDIITDVGTNVRSAGNGVVSFIGIRGGYGLTVEVEHSSGFKTVYAHLSHTLVTEGQKVARGKIIALTGNSGLSTGPHLHYEVHHDGIKLDPSQFFFDDLALFEPKIKK